VPLFYSFFLTVANSKFEGCLLNRALTTSELVYSAAAAAAAAFAYFEKGFYALAR